MIHFLYRFYLAKMAQPSIASFFNTRKRAAGEDLSTTKNKLLIESSTSQDTSRNDSPTPSGFSVEKSADEDVLKGKAGIRTRSGRIIKRIGAQNEISEELVPKKISKTEISQKKPKLVQFVKKGMLSPRNTSIAHTKQAQASKFGEDIKQTPSSTIIAFGSKNNITNVERGMRTPTKQIIKGSGATPLKHGANLNTLVKKELNFDEVKTKMSRSAKLQELKASLNRIQELEKIRKVQEERNRRLRDGEQTSQKGPVIHLKEFDKIEMEVLSSPLKTFKTPTKLPPPTPDKNELMSPRHTDVSKRVLFSPANDGSPSKMIVPPAYQRFLSLAEVSTAGKLPLPFKYRHLLEVFKGLDSVCAMFHNRKECITFKKLKPAVQRMLRKNFSEKHLAQIKHLYPEAFIFSQTKMRNYGSTSKTDYFQLVIAPNVGNAPEKQKFVKIDEDNILEAAQTSSMNPQVMTERYQRMHRHLLECVKNEHDKFLKSLDPPLIIPKDKVTRWHPDFDLEKCPDIELGHIPQPPNVEKYSSARDILSTARNLFNCATPIERALERYEAKVNEDRVAMQNLKNTSKTSSNLTTSLPAVENKDNKAPKLAPSVPVTDGTAQQDISETLLKGVPKSLLEKIRAKQAAKALDAMTRRPSQDEEATIYSRLPELARHLRNVFISEKKGVLTLEIVIKKIQNSFRTSLTTQEIETHLKLLTKEVPSWASLHEVRKTMYLKVNKEVDLSKVVETLEAAANEKSK